MDSCIFKNTKDDLEMLSEEFDTLGLPMLDLNETPANILEQIINNSHLLINLHRKLLSEMRDVNVSNQYKTNEKITLERKNESLRAKIENHNDKLLTLENKLIKSKNECNELKIKIAQHSKETDEIKRFYLSQQNENVRYFNKLTLENENLKEMCNKNIGKFTSKDDILKDYVNEMKNKEKVYKETIEKLEKNNKSIVEDNVKLRQELLITLCDRKD